MIRAAARSIDCGLATQSVPVGGVPVVSRAACAPIEIGADGSKTPRPMTNDTVGTYVPRGMVTITRHGEPVAVVVRPDTLRVRRASERLSDADRVRDLIASSRQAKLQARPTLSEHQADALLADVHAARSKR